MRRFLVIVGLALCSVGFAKWARPNLNVPIDRLVKNLTENLTADPNNAEAHYLVGRLHSIAFAEAPPTLELYGTEKQFRFPSWNTVKVHFLHPETTTKVQIDHLRESLLHYHRAVELDPKNGLYQLGLAWMYEEAIPYAGRVGKLPWISPGPSKNDLRNLALASYQRIYRDFLKSDLAAGPHMVGVQDVFVSEDAGEGILRLNGKNLSAKQRDEIKKNVESLKQAVSGITPIIFSLSGGNALNALVNNKARVGFDFMGDGYPRTWPWVTQDAGILVWDPKMSGKITSGRQLFGSATFWLFYSDGYAALASLDDNRDGWLTGKELRGIAIWQDRNLNGVSDLGEVVPVFAHNVEAIRTKPSSTSGILSADDGIRFTDGKTVPTYDWVPSSHPDMRGTRK